MANSEILLFGGAFNPPTVAHIQSANNAMFWCQETKTAQVGDYTIINARDFLFTTIWFLPCYKSRWGKEMVDGAHRVNMLRLAIQEASCAFNFMDVCDFEIENECTGGSYEIVQSIQNRYPNCRFSFLIGGDHADKMESWVEGKRFIEEFRFVVAGREGYIPHGNWYLKHPHVYVPVINCGRVISSTIARAQIAESGHTDLVYPSVMRYIKENHLYEGS